MEDLEGEHLRRDLNEQDDLDNLDLQYDRNNEYLDIEKFNSDLLFAVQGLGSVKQVNDIEIYVKGPHCEESIKDLIRLCRKDDSDEPLARKKLGVWKTFENDLIQLLLTQYQDKKLAFYLILLMVNLTEQPSKTCVIKNELKDFLYEYKLSFLKPQVIGTLMQHLGDCIENHQLMLLRKQREKGKNETKAHEQMIELIIILIKNILAIRDAPYNDSNHNEIFRNMHFHLLCQMKREHCFDLLIFLTQDFSKFDVLKKLDVIFLEIFYHIFSGFDPEWLCSAGGSGSSEFAKLLEKDRLEKKKLNQMVPSRHTRFQANFRFKRMLDDTKKLTTNPFAENKFNQTNVSKGQLNKPIPRKFLQSQEGIFRKKMHLDLKVDMPLQHNLTQTFDQDDEDAIKSELVTFKSVILQFSLEFIKYSFCPLFEQCYNLLYTDSEKLEPIDTVYYFVLMGFGLKLTRIVVFEHKASELEIVDVAVALQLTQFQLIFSKLVKEVTHNKKRSFNLKNFYSTVYVFNELLQVIRVMSTDNSQMNRKNAQIMLQNIFHHDITKALRIGIDYCQYDVLNNEVLKILIELINIFFDLLESYSKGKVLTLQTDKLVKKKKKKVNSKSKKMSERQLQNELNDFIEKDPNEGLEDDGDFNPNKELENQNVEKKEDGYDEDDDEDSDDDDDGPQFQERKYNLQSEFAILADYNVILKVLYLIQGDKILINSANLNNSVYKFIQRITDLLKADWILYQVDFISIIQEICSNQEIKMRLDCKKFIELFRKILRNMFEKMKQNKLLIVEMLFRFTDASLKNSILCNYEDLEKNDNELDNFLNENDAENNNYQQTILEKKVWIEQEDRAIINNYETFKDLTNVYEQLGLVLYGLGFYDKTPLDIRRRVKYLKLHKGKQRAEKIFKEIYASKKVSIKRAVRELYLKLKDSEENENNIEISDIQIFLDSIFVNFKEYIFFVEEQNTNLTDFERLVQVQDYCIVPYTVKDFDILNIQNVQQLLESLGFRPPAQGQIYWRVPGFFKVSDIDLLKEKVEKFLQNPESLLENNQEEGGEGQENQSSKKKKSKLKKVKNNDEMEEENTKTYIENEENQENNYKENLEEEDQQDVAFIRDYGEGEQYEEQQENKNENESQNNKSTSKKRKLLKVKQDESKNDDSEMIYMGYDDEQSNNENSQQNNNQIQSRKSSLDASKSAINPDKENSNSFVRQFLNESNNEDNKQIDENSMSANSMIFNKYINKQFKQ